MDFQFRCGAGHITTAKVESPPPPVCAECYIEWWRKQQPLVPVLPESKEVRTWTITINGSSVAWHEPTIGYQDVVDHSNSGRNPATLHTVVFARGVENKSGTLTRNQRVAIRDGMTFTAVVTDSA